jgi:hypothetical protein
MANTLARDVVISMIIFTFFIVGGISLMGSFFQDDSTFSNTDSYKSFNTTFNKMDSVTNNVKNMESSIKNADKGDKGGNNLINFITSFWDLLVLNGFNTLTAIFDSWSFIWEILTGIHYFFPQIPSWIPGILGMIITITLVFTIYSAIFRYEI